MSNKTNGDRNIYSINTTIEKGTISRSNINIGTYSIINHDNVKIKEDSVVLTLYSNEKDIGMIENEFEISGDLLRDIISKFGTKKEV